MAIIPPIILTEFQWGLRQNFKPVKISVNKKNRTPGFVLIEKSCRIIFAGFFCILPGKEGHLFI